MAITHTDTEVLIIHSGLCDLPWSCYLSLLIHFLLLTLGHNKITDCHSQVDAFIIRSTRTCVHAHIYTSRCLCGAVRSDTASVSWLNPFPSGGEALRAALHPHRHSWHQLHYFPASAECLIYQTCSDSSPHRMGSSTSPCANGHTAADDKDCGALFRLMSRFA